MAKNITRALKTYIPSFPVLSFYSQLPCLYIPSFPIVPIHSQLPYRTYPSHLSIPSFLIIPIHFQRPCLPYPCPTHFIVKMSGQSAAPSWTPFCTRKPNCNHDEQCRDHQACPNCGQASPFFRGGSPSNSDVIIVGSSRSSPPAIQLPKAEDLAGYATGRKKSYCLGVRIRDRSCPTWLELTLWASSCRGDWHEETRECGSTLSNVHDQSGIGIKNLLRSPFGV